MGAQIKRDRRQKLVKSIAQVEYMLDTQQYEPPKADTPAPVELIPYEKDDGVIKRADVKKEVAAIKIKPVNIAEDTAVQEEGHALVQKAVSDLGLKHVTKNIWLRGEERCAVRALLKPKYLLSMTASALQMVDTIILIENDPVAPKIMEVNATAFKANARFVAGVAGIARGKDAYVMPLCQALLLNQTTPKVEVDPWDMVER